MKKFAWRFLLLLVCIASFYGIGRLYFYLTAGFTIGNITSDFAYQPQWEVRPLLPVEETELQQALDQPYHYLGKGCQSYVFASEDGQYVIKFFKYQRYRLQNWIAFLPPLPAIEKLRQEKMEKKWMKLDGFVQSWKVAFENLKDETGLVFVHLNKTDHLQKSMTIYDKLGTQHIVSLDQMEFCIQKHAEMLCDALLDFRAHGDLEGAKQLIHQLLMMILSEYSRGLADNDHALMQNTGVAQGKPVHIDVGQFEFNEAIRQPEIFHQELFTKTYKFKIWLQEAYPEAFDFLESELIAIIGEDYPILKPRWRLK